MPVPPPVCPLDLDIPFESPKFNDSDFESLCAELFESEFGLRFQKYGVKGNSQFGIDLMSEEGSDGSYIAVQCKKVKRFSVKDVRSELIKFAEIELPIKVLYFVVTCDITTDTRNFIFEQRPKALDVEAVINIWSREYISRKLKDYPKLIADYFGQGWRNHFFPNLNEYHEKQRADKLTAELNQIKREHALLATRIWDSDKEITTTKIELKPIVEGYFKDRDGIAQLHGDATSLRGFSLKYSVSSGIVSDENKEVAASMFSIVLTPEDAIDLESVLIMDLYKPASVSTYFSHDVFLTHISGATPVISFPSRDLSFQFSRNVDYHRLLALIEDYLNSYSDIALAARRYRALQESRRDIPKLNSLLFQLDCK